MPLMSDQGLVGAGAVLWLLFAVLVVYGAGWAVWRLYRWMTGRV